MAAPAATPSSSPSAAPDHDSSPAPPRQIVVGVDGSDNSAQALRWALAEARLRADAVELVHCWQVSTYGDMSGMGAYPGDLLQKSAEEVVDRLLADVAGESGGVTITSRVVVGSPAHVLVEASGVADLLVVGRRGHGGFLSLVMGSVAQQVTAHAHCPVVVVADADANADE